MSTTEAEPITTAEQFAALPLGTLVRSPGESVFEHWHPNTGWCMVGHGLDFWHDEMALDFAPATVLWRPDRQPRPESEIKAEALREAAVDWWTLNRIDEDGGELAGDMADWVSDFVNLTTDEWLHARADHTEAAGR